MVRKNGVQDRHGVGYEVAALLLRQGAVAIRQGAADHPITQPLQACSGTESVRILLPGDVDGVADKLFVLGAKRVVVNLLRTPESWPVSLCIMRVIQRQ